MNYPSQKGKVIVITGANSGVGMAASIALARLGARVVMVCRDEQRGRAALADIRVQSGSDSVDLMLCDLASQKQIRQFVDLYQKSYSRLDVLVNNAGLMLGDRRLTEDSLEATFAINHLAPFLMTNLLLDRLKTSAPSRVITVSSGMHGGGRLNFNDLQSERGYSGQAAYAMSKLANILFTYELARRLSGTGVTANCLHPGVVATNFAREASPDWRRYFRDNRAHMATPEEGAETIVHLAAAFELRGVSGQYFVNRQPQRSSPETYKEDVARRLWEVSAKLTGLVNIP